MKLRWTAAVLIVLLFCASFATAAQENETCNLTTLFNGWARATVPGAPNGAAFGLLANLGDEADTLLSASTPAAQAVELHTMTMGEGDVMHMNPVEDGIAVGPRSVAELAPGGAHLMLIGLTEPLQAGAMLMLTLEFERAGEVQVALPIVDDTMPGEMAMDMATEAAEMPAPMVTWGDACSGVHVLSPWVRPAMPGMPNSAAYGTLVNLTENDVTLVSASTSAAQVVELHEMTMGEGDVMQMNPVEGGVVVPAGGGALLKPGGLHIMMIGLTGTLDAGTSIELTLTFDNGDEMTLDVPVQEPDAEPMTMGG